MYITNNVQGAVRYMYSVLKTKTWLPSFFDIEEIYKYFNVRSITVGPPVLINGKIGSS